MAYLPRVNKAGRAILPLVIQLRDGSIVEGEYELAEHALRFRAMRELAEKGEVIDFAMNETDAAILRSRRRS